MIYDYRAKKFYEDGYNDRLVIQNLSIAFENRPVPVAFVAHDQAPDEVSFEKIENPSLYFRNGVLEFHSGGKRIHELQKAFMFFSDSGVNKKSEGSLVSNGFNSEKHFDESTLKAFQAAIDMIAKNNGLVLDNEFAYFNDRMLLYMYPLIRTVANKDTNFHKLMQDMLAISSSDVDYNIPMQFFDHFNLSDALRSYFGTGSKEIFKFVVNNLVKKTDLIKSLSPELLTILKEHSSKIFGISEVTTIITQYEDISLDVIAYVKYILDVFEGNVDYTQTFLREKQDRRFDSPNKENVWFLTNYLSPKRRMSILLENDTYGHHIRDTVMQLKTYSDVQSVPWKLREKYPNGLELPKNWKTLKELHDKVSVMYNEIKAEDNNKTISYDEVEWGLHGMRKDNIELILPSEGKTLVEWGAEQNHCVASYAERAAAKECIIVGVKINGKHLYTIDLRVSKRTIPVPPTEVIFDSKSDFKIQRKTAYMWNINQFYGYKNHTPEAVGDGEIKKKVREMFTENFQTNTTEENHSLDALAYALQGGVLGNN